MTRRAAARARRARRRRARPRPRSRWRARSAPRSSRWTRCSSTGGWTSARRSRRPRSAPRAPPPDRRRGAVRAVLASRGSRSCAREALRRDRGRGRRRRCWSAGRASTSGRSVDDLEFPGTDPGTRAELEDEAARARRRASVRASRASIDPVAAARIEPANVRRTVRALEVAARSPDARSRRSPRPGSATRPSASAPRGSGLSRELLAAADRGPRALAMIERGVARRGARRWSSAGSVAGSPPRQAIGYAELARHLRGEMTLEEAIAGTVKRTRNLARRQLAWFRRDPRIRWFDAERRGAMAALDADPGVPTAVGGRVSDELRSRSTRGPGNDFVMVVDLDDERPTRSRNGRRAVRSAVRGRRRRRDPARPRGAGRRSFVMDYRNADGSRARDVRQRDPMRRRARARPRPRRGTGVRHRDARRHRGGSACTRTRARSTASTVEMGTPGFTKAAIPMRGPAWETFLGQPFDVGSGLTLHGERACRWATRISCCSCEEDPERVHVEHIGPALEHHELFPERTNVEFAAVLDGRDRGARLGAWRRARRWRAAAARAPSPSRRTRRGWRRATRSCGSPGARSRSSAGRTARSC